VSGVLASASTSWIGKTAYHLRPKSVLAEATTPLPATM
jgi:hypothetical protein